MTGVTRFTRAAGAIGVATTAMIVLATPLALFGRGRSPGLVAAVFVLILLAAIPCALVAAAGVMVRHRAYWWLWVSLGLTALAFLAWVADPGGAPAKVAGAAAAIVMGAGMLAAGEMPRRASAAILVSSVADLFPTTGTLRFALVLLGLGGYTVVSWTMWQEPLPDETPAHDAAVPVTAASAGASPTFVDF